MVQPPPAAPAFGPVSLSTEVGLVMTVKRYNKPLSAVAEPPLSKQANVVAGNRSEPSRRPEDRPQNWEIGPDASTTISEDEHGPGTYLNAVSPQQKGKSKMDCGGQVCRLFGALYIVLCSLSKLGTGHRVDCHAFPVHCEIQTRVD